MLHGPIDAYLAILELNVIMILADTLLHGRF